MDSIVNSTTQRSRISSAIKTRFDDQEKMLRLDTTSKEQYQVVNDVIKFLGANDPNGIDIDNIVIYEEGFIAIHFHRLETVYIKNNVISLTPPGDTKGQVEILGGGCYEGNCHFGCGCNCVVDRGFMDPHNYDANEPHTGCREES